MTSHDAEYLELEANGHMLRFPAVWLRDNCPCAECLDPVSGQKLTDITELPAGLSRSPAASWPRYLGEPADRARALDAVLRWGFVLLRDVPAEPGMVLEVAASFGFVRETNYGRLFDVRVEPRPGNLAFTSRRILPHTDNPYRDPAPTVQLLHCLRAVRTLALQGGPMTAAEVAAFEALPYYRDAVSVRRWDDQAKDPAVTAPRFAHFAPLLEILVRS